MANVQFDSVPIGATVKVVSPTPLPTLVPTPTPTIIPTPIPTLVPTPDPTILPTPTPSICDSFYNQYKEYVPYMDELLDWYNKDNNTQLSESEYNKAKEDGDKGYLDSMERSFLMEMDRYNCTIRSFTPSSIIGSIKVDCLQPETTVEYKGQTYLTPHTFIDLPYGLHTFNFSRYIFKPKSKTWLVYNPDIKEVKTVLSHVDPLPKPIYCTSQPSRSLQSFRDVCISNEKVKVDWNVLEGWMIDKTVGCYWWDLTEKERRSIAAIAIKNNINTATKTTGSGLKDCAGSYEGYVIGTCGPNSQIRYNKFGVSVPGSDKRYYGYSTLTPPSQRICYYTDKAFHLPTYIVMVSASPIDPNDDGFYHWIAAIQVSKDTSTWESFIFFQYHMFDVKPGSWNMPTDGYKTQLTLYHVLDYSGKYIYKSRMYNYKINY